MCVCVLSSHVWLRRHALPPEWDREHNYCPTAPCSRQRGTCQVRRWSQMCVSDLFFSFFLYQTRLIKMCTSAPLTARTRWWLKKRQWRKWRGSWAFRNVSPCPCPMARPRPAARRTTTQPSCRPAVCRRPVHSLWATTTLTTATGTALWIHERATLSTSKLWATSEGWVIVKCHQWCSRPAKHLILQLYALVFRVMLCQQWAVLMNICIY